MHVSNLHWRSHLIVAEEVISGCDRWTTSRNTQGHCGGEGRGARARQVWFPERGHSWIKCEGLQFLTLELFSSRERSLVWDGGLSPQAAPHQLCDLGQMTVYPEVSVFPLVRWGSWASEIQRFLLFYCPLICEVQHLEFQKTCDIRPKPTND